MILRGIHGSRRHELPHGNPWVAHNRHEILAALGSKCSWDSRMRQEPRLGGHCLQLLLQLLFLSLQPLFLITKLILLDLFFEVKKEKEKRLFNTTGLDRTKFPRIWKDRRRKKEQQQRSYFPIMYNSPSTL